MDFSFTALIGIFFTGLALNLTPCVYPMLSVTVAIFSRNSENSSISFLRAMVYVLGMAFMYSTLGVVAALTGGFFGSVIQSPLVLVAIAILMFLLSLSMFGVYELQVPSSVLAKISANKKTGFVGIFLSGLFVGVFAAPCIGPPIVALLTLVGQSANPVSGFLVFFILSLGLGLPYLIIGTFSGLVKELPRSGFWMVWVKKVFGAVLLGLALFYLTLALYPDFLHFVWPAGLTIGGIYLGFLDKTANENRVFKLIKMSTGSLALIGAFLFLTGKPAAGVVWERYSKERLLEAKQLEKPVVIDFFADWCIPCHELDKYTYTNKQVIQTLESFVRLKVDVTNPDTPEAMEPIERFEILGVPTILFLDPKGNEVPKTRITGYVTAAEFLGTIEPVLKTTETS